MSHIGTINERRLNIFKKADRLIVHSEYAMEILSGLLQENSAEHKIVKYQFPSSSYNEIVTDDKLESAKFQLSQHIAGLKNKSYFLFIGVVRRSKGIEMLLEAWSRFEFSDECSLVIAGKWAGIDEMKVEASHLKNCVLIDRYLSDEEYVVLIKNAKFIVLPYLDYAHSAILLSCLHLEGIVIISDISLFTEMLPSYPLTFGKGDIHQLLLILNKAARLSKDDLLKIRKSTQGFFDDYDQKLTDGIQSAFHTS